MFAHVKDLALTVRSRNEWTESKRAQRGVGEWAGTWVGMLSRRTTAVCSRPRQAVWDLAGRLKRKLWSPLSVEAIALRVDASALGQVRLVVLSKAHGNYE